ncbi:MAG: 16S rRNA (guanine(527)-N(7))-methyltransferase RsmG [Armatimonadetes bacterium]|nr:16S rRNA (guanine(527)-N(7))-methyltransferase RsmG [Armatimonadota bacterium]
MSFLPLERLCSGASELGIELTGHQLDQLDRFAEFLVEINLRFNLTRITDPEDIVTSHYLDSLTCLAALNVKPGERIMDVGAGAGFPGIPIKIARPDIDLTLLEATRKKVDFMNEAIDLLGLENAIAVHGRAEEIGHDTAYRERFGVVYARALSGMKVLVELCLPLVRVGGYVVAQKSSDIEQELAAARPMIGQLGGQIERMPSIHIPGTDITRTLVLIGKVKPTPERFPRAYGRIVAGRE